nr:type IV pilin protein [Haliea salexigens]
MLSSSRRSDAMNSLLRAQLLQQRWHAAHGHFGSVAEIWLRPDGRSLAGHYVLRDIPEVLPTGPDTRNYAMQAVPQGRQVGDACGTFAITQEGVLVDPPWAGADCWSR